jgi:hypothetical protein
MSRARDTAGIIQYNKISIDSNNAVGIGSSIPDTKLDVNGGVRVTGIVTASSFEGDFSGGATGDFSIADKIVHTGDTDTAIRFPTADTFTVETSGSEKLRITSNGKVGINTNDPQGILQINDGSNGLEFNVNSNNAVVAYNRTTSSYLPVGLQGSSIQLRIGGTGTILDANANGTITTGISTADGFSAGDSEKILLGNGDDLQLYHTGSASYITNSTGILYALSDTFEVKGSNGNETHLKTVDNGAVELYYDSSKRLETTTDGVDISGTGSIKVPVGTTAQRNGSPTAGDFRYNSDDGQFEGYTSEWGSIGGMSKTQTWLFGPG